MLLSLLLLASTLALTSAAADSPVDFAGLEKRNCVPTDWSPPPGTNIMGLLCGPGGVYECNSPRDCCYYGPSTRCPKGG